MKVFSKILFLLFILLFSANCGKRIKASGNQANAFLLADSVRQAASGNCAISINHAGLSYGVYINVAINNGGVIGINSALSGLNPATSGVFASVAASQSVELFTQANYEAASGSSVTEQGYSSYSAVPYNVKYDAFFKEGGSWTAEKRYKLIDFAKTFVDSFVPWVIFNANTSAGITALNGLQAPQSNIQDSMLYAVSSGSVSTRTAFISGLPGTATSLSAAITGFVGIGLQSAVNGTAALACARIPRANCSVGALTTPDRETDIRGAKDVVNAVFNNKACPIVSDEHANNILNSGFVGLPPKTKVTTIVGDYERPTNATSFPIGGDSSNGITSSTKILAERAYPKFGSLVGLGFGNLMPINKGTGTYVLAADKFEFGKNLEARVVESCETLGLTRGVTVDLPANLRKQLTSAPEIAYSLSTNGQAASLYANVSQGDPAACNGSFRSQFVIPQTLGGGKLPNLATAPAGDGGVTSLLSICVYGGTATKRAYAKTLLASGLGLTASQIPTCGEGTLEPAKAALKNASATFGEVGAPGDSFPDTTP